MKTIIEVLFFKYAESQESNLTRNNGVWVTKPFQNWKKVIEKMKAHAGSETHTRYVEAELLAKKRRINRTSLTTCWGS